MRSEPDQKDSAAAPKDATSVAVVLLRDIVVASAALSLFAAADAWAAATSIRIATLLSIVDGLLVGVALSALAHEWGHFTGVRLAGGTAPLRPAKALLPLFEVDYKSIQSDQFQSMSVGGNVAHWLVFATFAFGLPLTSSGQVALVSASFGFGVYASSIEFPVIRRTHNGAGALEALGGIRKDYLRHNGRIGALAALTAYIIL
jgi:hypothetical protein